MKRHILALISIGLVNSQSVVAHPGPGRCGAGSDQFTIAAGNLTQSVLPFSQCLVGVEERFGFNNGPFAVQQCSHVRRSISTKFNVHDRRRGERLLDQLGDQYVWLAWCSTDVGNELPITIPIKAGWPQRAR